MQQLFKLGENLAVVNMVRCGRMTALAKPDGGVRGIVSGDVLRRLVPRTMAQQLGPAVKAATAPHQYALSTRAGCECIAHALQGLCELNPRTTITSIDGVGAYDLVSRKAMLIGLRGVDGGNSSLPFVRMFYGSPSQYLWEDDIGETQLTPQGEGGEHGDAMMPLLYSVGQHDALQVAHRGMRDGEHLMAFLEDVYMATDPDRVGLAYASPRFSVGGGKHQDPREENKGMERGGHSTCHLRRFGESGPQELNPSSSKGSKSWEPHSATQHTSRGS